MTVDEALAILHTDNPNPEGMLAVMDALHNDEQFFNQMWLAKDEKRLTNEDMGKLATMGRSELQNFLGPDGIPKTDAYTNWSFAHGGIVEIGFLYAWQCFKLGLTQEVGFLLAKVSAFGDDVSPASPWIKWLQGHNGKTAPETVAVRLVGDGNTAYLGDPGPPVSIDGLLKEIFGEAP